MTEKQIQQKIVEETGIPINQIILANRSMFEFVRKEIESGNRKPIRLWKLGVFSCKEQRVKKLEEKGLLNRGNND